MHIVVAGVGGVGGYIGAHLCKLDDDVTFIARGEHAQKIKTEGLLIREDDKEWYAHPSSVMDAEALDQEIDLLILCVKSYDIEMILQKLSKNITPQTIIIPFANGVEHKEKIEELIEAKVFYGAVYILAHKAADGVIVKKGKVFAALFGNSAYPQEVEQVSTLFEAAGLRHKTPENIEEAIWKKYLFISAFGALTSYFDTTMRQVYELHKNWAETLLLEIAAVAKSKDIDIEDEVPKALQTASKLPESASSSMHLDFQQGRRVEVETLCGYIVREGKKAHLSTPMMAKIYSVLKVKANREPSNKVKNR